MSIRDTRRAATIERMADHLLGQGLGGASLRPLAAAAGTSDRMLLYYFADRDELLVATLECVAARLTAMLDAALPPDTRLPFATLLGALWSAVGTPAMQPYMQLWLEVAAHAARDATVYGPIATSIMQGFASWAEAHLDEADPSGAALLLGVLEGALFLAAVGRRDLADAAVAGAAARF